MSLFLSDISLIDSKFPGSQSVRDPLELWALYGPVQRHQRIGGLCGWLEVMRADTCNSIELNQDKDRVHGLFLFHPMSIRKCYRTVSKAGLLSAN